MPTTQLTPQERLERKRLSSRNYQRRKTKERQIERSIRILEDAGYKLYTESQDKAIGTWMKMETKRANTATTFCWILWTLCCILSCVIIFG